MKMDRKVINILLKVYFLITVILQIGCQLQSFPEECEEFFRIPSSQGEREFSLYDLEKQLTIHQCALYRKPGTKIYSYKIAKRGSSIIPTLLDKLDGKNYKNSYEAEKSKYAVILIFQALAENGDLDNHKEAIPIIEKSVSEIRTDWTKEEVEDSLTKIKGSIH